MDNCCSYGIKAFSDELGLTDRETAALYTEFIEEVSIQVGDLPSFFGKNDIESIRKNLHNIKGLASNYRITDVYECTVQISQAVKTSDKHTADRITDLVSIWARARQSILNYFSSLGAAIYPNDSAIQSD